jgi:hypothetical protein
LNEKIREEIMKNLLKDTELTKDQIRDIAVEAYIYFYPLVLMEATRKVGTNVEKPVGLRGPINTFAHVREFPPASFRDVVRPNFDTLYSSAWLNLKKEPVILSVPDIQGRYYMMPMLDMWTDVFSVPGKRTTGTKPGHFALVGPKWNGTLPKGVNRIDSPTSTVCIIGRTQTNGPKDYAAVNKIQDGYGLTPLSQWGKESKTAPVKIDPAVDMKTPPMIQVDNMPASEYFKLAFEIVRDNPPHIIDTPILSRMSRIGLFVGKSFDMNKADPIVKEALEQTPSIGLKTMKEKMPTMAKQINGWQMNTESMGVYGTNYLRRAIVALIGLGANLPEDAVYPINLADSEGKPTDGQYKYVLHFDKDQLPPVEAFWSVTMYDAQGFPVSNEINRCAIGDRDDLKYNADGSLDLFIQNEKPPADKVSNWLPAPKDPFGVVLRLYAPRSEVIQGGWVPPAIKKIS